MNDGEALAAGVAASPADDGPRLALADWLRDNGQEELAGLLQGAGGRPIVERFGRFTAQHFLTPTLALLADLAGVSEAAKKFQIHSGLSQTVSVLSVLSQTFSELVSVYDPGPPRLSAVPLEMASALVSAAVDPDLPVLTPRRRRGWRFLGARR